MSAKLLGWDSYDSHQALEAINDLYRNELRLTMNMFLPSVKLVRKVRVGSPASSGCMTAPRPPWIASWPPVEATQPRSPPYSSSGNA
jgi:hypothetical protein